MLMQVGRDERARERGMRERDGLRGREREGGLCLFRQDRRACGTSSHRPGQEAAEDGDPTRQD